MADLTDVLTSIQNLVQATSTLGSELTKFSPSLTSGQLTADKLVQTGFVRVLGVSVTTAGSGAGALHDSGTLGAASSSNEIYSVAATLGYYPFQPSLIVNDGLVYKPGSGQKVTIFFTRS